MVLKTKTKLYKLGPDKYAIYLPKDLATDSQFPFKDPKYQEPKSLEVVVMPSKIEGVGKLLVRPAKQEQK